MRNKVVFCFIIVSNISVPLRAQVCLDRYLVAMGVELLFNTSFNIPCERFAIGFKPFLETKKIYDVDSIRVFNSFVAKAKPSKKKTQLDVRRQFVLVNDDKQLVVVCSDGINVEIDGILIKRGERFLLFLESMLPASVRLKD